MSCNRGKYCYNETEMNVTPEVRLEGHGLTRAESIIMITFHVILAVAAVFGSYLILRAFHKLHSLRTASNVILASLSIADGLLAIPSVLDVVHLNLRFGDGHWSCIMRNMSSCSSFFLLSVIILHLALISLERSIAVRFALRYHIIVTHRRALIVSIAMWLLAAAVLFVVPQVLKASIDDFEQLRQAMNPYSKTPEVPPNRDLPPLTKGYLIFLLITLLVIPLVIILWSYSYIFIVSLKNGRQIREQADISGLPRIKHEMKANRAFAVVIGVCPVSYTHLTLPTIYSV